MLQNLTDEQLVQYHSIYKDGINESVRFYDRKKNGFDTKFFYHILRLLDEAEQILSLHDLDLQRARKEMKAIRAGEWSLEKLEAEIDVRQVAVEKLYSESTLQNEPDREKIRQILVQCLEMHYGPLTTNEVVQNNLPLQILQNIQKELEKVRTLI